ncbi:MAG: SRPBCC family protein [Ktedonobacteraceae bacterium]|nr:SRPBCC family protein [Ktedonobacteraceae bacterium]
MGLNVCPAAIVAAPIEIVWALVSNPSRWDEWADVKTVRIVPEGLASPGQMIYVTSRALGRTWHISFKIEQVNPDKHQLRSLVALPLGMRLYDSIICTPIGARSCRVQYG